MRCFLAIELPETVRSRLISLREALRELDRSIRWTKPEQIHLTLKFLGEVPDRQITDVCEAIVKAARLLPPVPIEVGGVGCFPMSGPVRIVWAGVRGPSPELLECHAACERFLAELGYPPEERAFKPHLTIGRAREQRGARGVRRIIDAAAGFDCPPFIAQELVVFQSVLSPKGPTYTPLARAALREP